MQYFPTKGLRGAAFSVDEVTPGHVMLQVLLSPAKSSGLEPTEFYIGLRQRQKNGPWRVDYWAPVNVVAVPGRARRLAAPRLADRTRSDARTYATACS